MHPEEIPADEDESDREADGEVGVGSAQGGVQDAPAPEEGGQMVAFLVEPGPVGGVDLVVAPSFLEHDGDAAVDAAVRAPAEHREGEVVDIIGEALPEQGREGGLL